MRRAPAFTLIEAITAVAVAALLVPPTMWALRQAHLGRVEPIQASTARWLATERLEDVIADRHSTTRGWVYVVTGNYPAEASVVGFAGYARNVSIQEFGPDLASAGTGYKVVTVRVSWAGGAGVQRVLAVATVLTDY